MMDSTIVGKINWYLSSGLIISARPALTRLPNDGALGGSPRPIYVMNTSLPIAPGIVSAMRSMITDTIYGSRFFMMIL